MGRDSEGETVSTDTEITIGGDSVDIPNGTYPATLDSIVVKESAAFGEFRAWTFALEGGALVGGASSMNTGSKSKAGKWIRALLGSKPEKGTTVQLAGRHCMVVVEEDANGWPQVTDVLPPMGAPAKQAAAAADDDIGNLPF